MGLATEQIEEWIKKYGCERDALNVALAMLDELNARHEKFCDGIDARLDAVEARIDNILFVE